ncbi:MAG: hypothetical protein HYS08_01785 [Chlamydiae bacterium]|nr:hypothetical protein [Chlamydiota bacterium]
MLSFISGSGVKKTYLTLIDTKTRDVKKYHFKNYSMDGPHEIICSKNQAVVSAYYVEGYVYQYQLLVIDLASGQIRHDFLLPKGCRVIAVKKPDVSEHVLVLLQKGEKALLKEIDLLNFSMSDSELIGRFSINSATFLERVSSIILDVAKKDRRLLLIYDLNTKSVARSYSFKNELVDLKESMRAGFFYGLFQSPGDNKGEILEFNVAEKSYRSLIQLVGEMDTLLVLDKTLFVIGQDLDRAHEQKKYWLHPRDLFVIDSENSHITDTVDWSQRDGKFIGFNLERDEIYYAVVDNDDPALWLIQNQEKTLSKVYRSI